MQTSIYNQLKAMGYQKEQIFSFDTVFQFLKQSAMGVPLHLELEEFEAHLDGYEWAYQFFNDRHSKEILLKRIRGYLLNEIFDTYIPEEEAYFIEEIPLSDREIFVDAGMYTGDTTKVFAEKQKENIEKLLGLILILRIFKLRKKILLTCPISLCIAKGYGKNLELWLPH